MQYSHDGRTGQQLTVQGSLTCYANFRISVNDVPYSPYQQSGNGSTEWSEIFAITICKVLWDPRVKEMGDKWSIFLTKLLSHGNSTRSSFTGRMFYLGGNNHILLPKHEIQLYCELKAVLKGLSFLSFILISCESGFSSLLSFTFERA